MRPEVVLALLTRGTQGLVLAIAAVCVVLYLSPAEQGVFFVYMSLGTLVQLSDFGLSYATLQTASHLAHPGGEQSFYAFRARAHRLNFGILSVAAVLISILGFVILSSRLDVEHPEVRWSASWVAFIAATFLTLLVNLELTLIEGGKSQPLAWAVRFFQELVSGTVFIAAMIAGAGLWSLACYWAVRFALVALWLATTRSGLARSPGPENVHFDWRKEVWPFQWKIGLSVACGFLIFQAFNPIVLYEQGPVVAGKFGMSLALMNMLVAVTTAWPMSQAARYGSLIRHQRFDELRHAFWRMCIASSVVAAAAALVGLVVLIGVEQHAARYAARFADVATTGILLATAVVHHVTHCFAVVLRAERRDPTFALTVVGSILLVTTVWICAHTGGPREIAIANLAITLPGIPLVIHFYRKRKTRWSAGSDVRSV